MDEEKLQRLQRPFSGIRSRPGRNGQSIQYIEGHAIVQRLNDALVGDWSFKVLEHEIGEQEVLVLAELRTGDVVKQAFGGAEITRSKEGKVVSIADDCKAAATDALKKAATLLGVGLQMHVEAQQKPAAPRLVPQVQQEGEEPDIPQSNRLTRKQAEFIARLTRTNGLSKGEVDALARDRYGKSYSFLTVKEASEFIQQLNHAA